MPATEARVPVSDRGFAYGDGAFTTLRVARREPLLLYRHLRRLRRDLAALRISPPSPEELAAACRGLVERLEMGEGVVKITVTRGPGARGPSPGKGGEPTVVVTASGLPEPRPPLRAVSVPDARGSLVRHKTLNYLTSVLALWEAEVSGRDEAVFVRDGELLEASVSNLAGVADGELLTPPAGRGLLPGVVREVLLEAGTVAEGPLPVDTGGPLYCINAVRGVEPVAELDGRGLALDRGLEERLRGVLGESGAL